MGEWGAVWTPPLFLLAAWWDLSTVLLILGCEDDEGVYFGKRERVGGGGAELPLLQRGEKKSHPFHPAYSNREIPSARWIPERGR